MDLDDLLEDLLEEAGRAARRGARSVVRGTAPARRGIRRAVRATGLVTAVVLILLAALAAGIGDPGVMRQLLAGVLAIGGLGAGGVAAAAHALDRRDPVVQRQRAKARGELAPEVVDDDLRELPRDVRGEFGRLLQAHRLVRDLAADGWVDRAAVLEVDGQIARLHHLLVTDGRAVRLGGRPSAALRTQVADLADLLVALADEAVQHQVEDLAGRDRMGVGLAQAHDHLVALREARQEVARAEDHATGHPPMPGTA